MMLTSSGGFSLRYLIPRRWRRPVEHHELLWKGGTEITPEIADDLAVEAERDDLSKAKRRRVGRPPLAGAGASPRLSFRATPDLYRAAQKQAKEEGRSISDLAREAVARFVNTS